MEEKAWTPGWIRCLDQKTGRVQDRRGLKFIPCWRPSEKAEAQTVRALPRIPEVGSSQFKLH